MLQGLVCQNTGRVSQKPINPTQIVPKHCKVLNKPTKNKYLRSLGASTLKSRACLQDSSDNLFFFVFWVSYSVLALFGLGLFVFLRLFQCFGILDPATYIIHYSTNAFGSVFESMCEMGYCRWLQLWNICWRVYPLWFDFGSPHSANLAFEPGIWSTL